MCLFQDPAVAHVLVIGNQFLCVHRSLWRVRGHQRLGSLSLGCRCEDHLILQWPIGDVVAFLTRHHRFWQVQWWETDGQSGWCMTHLLLCAGNGECHDVLLTVLGQRVRMNKARGWDIVLMTDSSTVPIALLLASFVCTCGAPGWGWLGDCLSEHARGVDERDCCSVLQVRFLCFPDTMVNFSWSTSSIVLLSVGVTSYTDYVSEYILLDQCFTENGLCLLKIWRCVAIHRSSA